MYSSFTIKDFRCFENFSIEPLGRVNLIAGRNNVGKTALLEAVWLLNGPDIPELGVRLNSFRGLSVVDPREFLWDLFAGFDPTLRIVISANGSWGNGARELSISLRERQSIQVPLTATGTGGPSVPERSTAVSEQSNVEIVLEYRDESGNEFTSRGWYLVAPVAQPLSLGLSIIGEGIEKTIEQVQGRAHSIYMAARHRVNPKEDADRFGKLQVSGEDDGVLEALRILEPRLKRLVTAPIRDIPVVHGDIGTGRMVPLPLMGDGMGRLFSLAVTFATATKGTVLVDEIENGLHHTVMVKVWRAIAAFARKYDVQVFTTTHSEGCVRAAYEAFESDEPYDFRFHRLDRVNGETRAVTYDQEMLRAALQSGLEVR